MFSIWAKQQTIPSISASDSSKFQFYICFRSFRPDFLSVFHGEDAISPHELRIDCKFSCLAAAKRAIYPILSANGTCLPCGCRRRCKGFPSASSWPWTSGDRSALSVSRTSLSSQSPSLWQVPSLCRPTAYSSSMAVSDLLSRRRISGSVCCRSAVPSVSGSSVPCTSSGTSGQLSLQEWRTTCVPASASCFSLPDRSPLPSSGEEAISYPAQFALLESWIVELVKIELRKRNVWRYFRKISYFWHAD